MKKHLEMLLQQLETYSKKPELEQYATPADIASDLLWYAFQKGDIKGRIVVDLGCGNGIFAIGAAILGGKAIGIDIDEKAIEVAKRNAARFGVRVEYMVADVNFINIKGDVVIMNPPFGAQYSNRKADTRFMEKAMEIANIIYSLHMKKTIEYIKKLVISHGFFFSIIKNYRFPIKASMPFHSKKIAYFDVVAINARRNS